MNRLGRARGRASAFTGPADYNTVPVERFYHHRITVRHLPARRAETSSRDMRWLDRATKLAGAVDGRWRVGCVIVRGGRVLSSAANAARNDPQVCQDRLWCSSEHAEAAALRLAGDVRGATAYVARVGRDGKIRHAQPCARCQRLLDDAGVTAVWTSDPDYVRHAEALHGAR